MLKDNEEAIKGKGVRLAETIWHRQWSNPEDCLAATIDLMKMIDPDHPMVTAKTLREAKAAKKDSYSALKEENATKDARIAELEDVLAYFVGYHNDGVGQLTHALARAEGILSSKPSGKLENLLQLTKETQQLLTTLNLVAVNREKLREIEWAGTWEESAAGCHNTHRNACLFCGGSKPGTGEGQCNPEGHAPDCWLGKLLKEDR